MDLRMGWRFFWKKLTAPVSPYPLAAFRILYGFVLILNGIFFLPDISVWFSSSAVSSLTTVLTHYTGGRLNLFTILGDSGPVVTGLMAVYLVSAFAFLAGWRPRWMAIILFLCLVSLTHRNPLAFTSGDTLLRLLALFFAIAPSASVWAVRKEGFPGQPVFPVALRLMQFQVCLVYGAGFLAKLQGSMWRDGTAVYIVQQLSEFERFPLPDFLHSGWASRWLTWGTMALEGLFPVLVWFKETRLPILATLVLFHLGIEYSMNIQLFEWTMIACSVLFLKEQEIRAPVDWIARHVFRRPRQASPSVRI